MRIQPGHRVELDENTDLVFMGELSDSEMLFAVHYKDSGELREQGVSRANLHAKWEESVKKRAAKVDRKDYFPHLLVPRR